MYDCLCLSVTVFYVSVCVSMLRLSSCPPTCLYFCMSAYRTFFQSLSLCVCIFVCVCVYRVFLFCISVCVCLLASLPARLPVCLYSLSPCMLLSLTDACLFCVSMFKFMCPPACILAYLLHTCLPVPWGVSRCSPLQWPRSGGYEVLHHLASPQPPSLLLVWSTLSHLRLPQCFYDNI